LRANQSEQPIVVDVQIESEHATHENRPQGHARAAIALVDLGRDFFFEHGEQFLAQRQGPRLTVSRHEDINARASPSMYSFTDKRRLFFPATSTPISHEDFCESLRPARHDGA
jgi:hypothetical protein